ncbi:MAG: NTF2 fold immunity protein [Bacteroidota bacterium]
MNDSLYRTYENRIVQRKDRVVKSKHQAKKTIEPLAIAKYGDQKDERPYEIHLINGLWFMKGTLSKRWTGGTIIGVLDSKTGEVLFIMHTK